MDRHQFFPQRKTYAYSCAILRTHTTSTASFVENRFLCDPQMLLFLCTGPGTVATETLRGSEKRLWVPKTQVYMRGSDKMSHMDMSATVFTEFDNVPIRSNASLTSDS
jgi:hypothetical protein